jgi:ABC-type nitrate/sulfonate/bicarbonate transport system permease component
VLCRDRGDVRLVDHLGGAPMMANILALSIGFLLGFLAAFAVGVLVLVYLYLRAPFDPNEVGK